MSEALGNPRERIFIALTAHPGVHLRDIPRLVGFSLRAVRYHLRVLEREALVSPHRSGRFVRWFPRGVYSRSDQALIGCVRVRPQREVLRALLARSPQRFTDLARGLPISRVSLSRSLRALEAQAIVRACGPHGYELADHGAVAMRLALYRQRFPDLLADAADEIFDK